ncbi:MAG: hypothetical protein WCT08_01920 [Patescibacteria group bacterium]|jgi:glycosyltransferase involved in cell wall biosynthesis
MFNPSKKILIVSSWAPPDIGGPQSLYAFFSQFPPESFVILTSFYSEQQRKTGNWLPCDYYYYDHPPVFFKEQKLYHKIHLTTFLKQKKNKSPKRPSRIKTIVKKLPLIMAMILGYILVKKIISFYSAGKKLAFDENIQVILGTSDSGPSLIAAYLLSKKSGKPLCYFLFDIYKGNFLEAPSNWVANLMEKRMFKKASKIFITNEGTAEYYRKRYPFLHDRLLIIHNSVFPEEYENQRTSYQPKPPFTILFTGHVYWAQEQSVLNMIKAMDYLTDIPVKLELFIPNAIESIKLAINKKPNITLSSAPPSEMPKIQSRATLLFLPLAWNTKSPDIVATATPGKFTGYLASGRPMLIHAPDYAYVSQYARKNNLGLVVDQNNIQLLADSIREFLKHPEQGQIFIKNSLEIFYQNHDARQNFKKLTESL